MTDLILVTGASGFLGRSVVDYWLERNQPVRGMVRDAKSVEGLHDTVVVKDLTDREAVRRAMHGVDVVVHLAARVHVLKEVAADPGNEFRKVNVDGTRVLVEEAAKAGVGLFVFASTVKAIGEQSDAPWTEVTIPEPVGPYGRSKREAEQIVEDLCGRAGMCSAILRLPLVYGPGVRANFLRLLRAIARGVPLPFASIDNARSVVFSGNVAAAIDGLCGQRPNGTELFMVSDGIPVSTPDLVRKIANALGRPPRLVSVPPAVFRLTGRLGDLADRIIDSPVTSAHIQRLLGSLVVDSRKLADRLAGWPPYSTEEGLRLTAEWFLRLPRLKRRNFKQ